MCKITEKGWSVEEATIVWLPIHFKEKINQYHRRTDPNSDCPTTGSQGAAGQVLDFSIYVGSSDRWALIKSKYAV